jgi:hypothetical protein
VRSSRRPRVGFYPLLYRELRKRRGDQTGGGVGEFNLRAKTPSSKCRGGNHASGHFLSSTEHRELQGYAGARAFDVASVVALTSAQRQASRPGIADRQIEGAEELPQTVLAHTDPDRVSHAFTGCVARQQDAPPIVLRPNSVPCEPRRI